MKELTSLEELEHCIESSKGTPLFIFKHSTACPVSAEAHRRVRDYLAAAPEDCPEFVLVKVIESRPLSNRIAETAGVEHKSPQLILIKDAQGVWSSSHLHISKGGIEWATDHHVRGTSELS